MYIFLTRMLAPQREEFLSVWFIVVYPIPRTIPGTCWEHNYSWNECMHEKNE